MRGRCDHAVFENVGGFKAEDADRFDADVLIRGEVNDGRVGIVGDGARQHVGSASVNVGDVREGNFDGLESAVVIEIEAGELARAEFIVDVHARVDFFAAVTIGLEADVSLEQFDLRREFGDGLGFGILFCWCLRGRFFGGRGDGFVWRLLRSLSRPRARRHSSGIEH